MSKKAVMVSIDEFSHKKAQMKGFNISEVLDRALRDKLDENEAMNKSTIKICSLCKKEIESGYFCPQHKMIMCEDCEKTWDYKKCVHDIKDGIANKMHYHIRFGFVPESYGKTLKDIEKGNADHIISNE